jgi:dihydrofolate reductase
MGRKTFESIGRPLPKRQNIVISRGFDAPEGVIVVGSLEEAYMAAGNSVIPDLIGNPRCFIMGGGQIYAQAMPDMDRLIVTHVHTVIEDADTFFPPVDPSVWIVESRSEMYHDEESGFDFEFVEYVKR